MFPVNEIDTADVERLRQEADSVLVDVRTDPEVARGMIEGAMHLPLHLLPEQHTALPADRPVIVYCQSGARSAQACAWLSANGHSVLYNLRGGVLAWLRDGRRLVPRT